VIDTGYVIDTSVDCLTLAFIVRGGVAVVFDVRRGWRALRTWWRWQRWS
jgi:hypothetical protein